MELRNSYSSELFSLHASKLNSMALSLESLLTKRRTKKTTPVRRFIQHRANYNVIPPQDTASKWSNDTTSNVTVNLSTMPNVLTQHNLTSTDNNTTPINITTNSNYTSSHINSRLILSPALANALAARASLPSSHLITCLLYISPILLSPEEIFVLTCGLTSCPTPRHINWPEISADIYQGHPTSIFGKYLLGRRFEI